MQIRPFQDMDLNRVLDIAVAAWAPVFRSSREALGPALSDQVNPDPEARKRSRVAAECRGEGGTQVWVADDDGEVAGFIAVRLDRQALIGEIGNNAVDPARQHRGIGSLMYTYVLDWMRQEGMKSATVSTGGDAAHAPARRAYEKVGFSRSLPSVRYYRSI